MPRVLDPFRFVRFAVAGWLNQRQLQMIEYLREENRVLREQLGERRLRFTDDPSWKEFLKQHWELIVAADFFTIEVWTAKGLQRFVVLFFIELSTRRVQVGGIAAVANGLWMSQIARNLTDTVDGLLTGKRYLIHDRDPLFTAEFLRTLEDAGVTSVKLPPRSPNLNAYAGAVRAQHQGMLFGTADPVRRMLAAHSRSELRGSLPP